MKRIILIFLAALLLWILIDLNYSKKVNLADFNSIETARIDTEMWRSYYEKKPMKLFFQMTSLLRTQMKAPFWRSYIMAFHAAKAAFIFKAGKNREDYAKVLPDLEKYYEAINKLSYKPFNIKTASKNELEWWIIRREKDLHTTAEWAVLQAKVASEIYQKPVLLFREFGQLRTEAMFFRDGKGENITEKDWEIILKKLELAWGSLHAMAK